MWRKRAFAWPAQCLLTCGPSFKAVKASKFQGRRCWYDRRATAADLSSFPAHLIDVNTPQKKGAALRVLSMDVHQPVGII